MISNHEERRRLEFAAQRALAERDARRSTTGERPPLRSGAGDSEAIESLVKHEPAAINCGSCGESLRDGLRGEADGKHLITCSSCNATNELSDEELGALARDADIAGVWAQRHGLAASDDAFMTCRTCQGGFRILNMTALPARCPGCAAPLSITDVQHTAASARQLREMTAKARRRAGAMPVLL